jgi:hypothetical protein
VLARVAWALSAESASSIANVTVITSLSVTERAVWEAKYVYAP